MKNMAEEIRTAMNEADDVYVPTASEIERAARPLVPSLRCSRVKKQPAGWMADVSDEEGKYSIVFDSKSGYIDAPGSDPYGKLDQDGVDYGPIVSFSSLKRALKELL